MTNLEKLLVIVPLEQCVTFRDYHIPGGDHYNPLTDKYKDRIVFLEDTKQLYTHGEFYGGSDTDLSDIKAILAGFGTGGNYTTVSAAINDVIEKLNESDLINVTYTATGLTVTDTASLHYDSTTANLYLGGWDATTSTYSTVIGQSLPVADTGAKVADEVTTYVAATTSAIREYLSTELGDIANALTFIGGYSDLQHDLDPDQHRAVKKDVGNLYVMDSFGEDPDTHKPITTAEITVGGTKYKLELGDSVIIKSVEGGQVTGVIVTERNLDGAVTASDALVAGRVIIGKDGTQSVESSQYFIGTDEDAITENSATYTLASEKAVGIAIKNVLNQIDELDANYTYTAAHTTGNYVTYTYVQTNGLVSGVSVAVDQAIVTYNTNTGAITVEGNGFIDNNAANAIISYVTGKVEELDESFTTVSAGQNATYITVEDNPTPGSNDHDYTVDAHIVALGNAVGMQYDETTGQWVPASGVVNHGLLDAADVAAEIIADEQVVAAALNDHESRIDDLESATGAISISSGNTDALTVTKGTGLTYTITPQTAAVTSGANTLVTGGQVYTYVGGAIGGLDVSTQTVIAAADNTADGGLKFTYTETDGIVTIDSFTYTEAYVGIDGLEASVTRSGLVTGAELARVINALDPWEEYAGEPAQP